MVWNSKKSKTVKIYFCPECGTEVSDKENNWIITYNRCPKCNKYIMKARDKGKIKTFKDYSDKIALEIGGRRYSHNYFFNYVLDNKYNEETNTIIISLDFDKIKEEFIRKITEVCYKQNTKVPEVQIKTN